MKASNNRLSDETIKLLDNNEHRMNLIVTAILGGVLGGLAGYTFGASFDAAIFFIFFAVLTVIAFVDMDTMEIPPVLNLIILVLGIISLIGSFVSDSGQMLFEITWQQRLIGFFSVSVFMLVVTLLVAGAFGGGDIKLMAAAGLLLGWRGTLIAFLIGLIVGAVIGIILMSRKKRVRRKCTRGLFSISTLQDLTIRKMRC